MLDGYPIKGTTRAGLLFGALALLSNLAVGILALNICAPFLGIIWGVAAGITSINWSEPASDGRAAAKLGARAGTIAGVGAFIGLSIGMTIWFTMMGGQDYTLDLAKTLAETQGLELLSNEEMGYLARYNLVGLTCCLGVVNIAVLAASGAIGAYFYSSSTIESP